MTAPITETWPRWLERHAEAEAARDEAKREHSKAVEAAERAAFAEAAIFDRSSGEIAYALGSSWRLDNRERDNRLHYVATLERMAPRNAEQREVKRTYLEPLRAKLDATDAAEEEARQAAARLEEAEEELQRVLEDRPKPTAAAIKALEGAAKDTAEEVERIRAAIDRRGQEAAAVEEELRGIDLAALAVDVELASGEEAQAEARHALAKAEAEAERLAAELATATRVREGLAERLTRAEQAAEDAEATARRVKADYQLDRMTAAEERLLKALAPDSELARAAADLDAIRGELCNLLPEQSFDLATVEVRLPALYRAGDDAPDRVSLPLRERPALL